MSTDAGTQQQARPRPHFHPLVVAAVEPLTDDSVAVRFDVPGALREAFAFRAGQSLTLRRVVDGREHRRSYSICAAAGAPLRIGVREVPGGLFSSWLVHEVRPGDVVEVQTPSGTLRADPSHAGRHLAIAAGSGITPLLSVAATVLTQPETNLTLLYGNRTSGSVMFGEELADLKNRYGARLNLVHVLSREPRTVELLSGRLDADRLRRLLTLLVPVAALDHVWLCGPYGLVTDAREVLTELGVDPARVHAELFFVDEPPPEPRRDRDQHPDPAIGGESGSTSEVTVALDGRRTTTTVTRRRSVLDTVAEARGDLPFACKGGVCGTCRAKVTAGEVDLRRNYALEEAELAQGFVLTCQSYPLTAQVTVDFDA